MLKIKPLRPAEVTTYGGHELPAKDTERRVSNNRTFIDYPAVVLLSLTHLLAIASVPYMYIHGIHIWEVMFNFVAAMIGGFGITALYHRAWAHNAVSLARPVEYVLALFSVFMLQMPARQWISTHIRHHQHTDQYEDPYNIQRGFLWAHFEWIIFSPVPTIKIPARLNDNPVIRWQERYYWPLCVLLMVAVPVLLSIAVGAPWWGGLLLSALRLVLMSHAVYGVNSVCHKWGTRPFTTDVSARDVWWFPFVLGEQYHNYHHAFPRDYRHGVDRFAFDPTKWLIFLLARVGLAHNLFAVPPTRVWDTRQEVLSSLK